MPVTTATSARTLRSLLASDDVRIDLARLLTGAWGAEGATYADESATLASIALAGFAQALDGASELTIASGSITPTGPAHTVDTESDDASDTLNTIAAYTGILILSQADPARDVEIAHGTSANEVSTPDGQTFALSDYGWAILYRESTSDAWRIIGGSGGGSSLADDIVTNAKLANMAQATIKGRASGAGTGDPVDLTPAQVRTILNVEDDAAADQTGAEIKTALEGEADTNTVTDAEKTVLGNTSGVNTGDEPAANDTTPGIVELATVAETDAGLDATRAVTPAGLAGSALQAKVDGIEAGADVTDTANVTAAGALMDSEVDADLKTLSLPAGTTISAFGATLVDDLNAAAARTTLDVDQAGTDNSPAASTTTPGKVELATAAEVDTGTDATRAVTPDALANSALQTKVDGIEAGADVTDTANVTAAGALMDSEVDADIKTLSLPASTTISAFGATLVDDADAEAARTTLGVTSVRLDEFAAPTAAIDLNDQSLDLVGRLIFSLTSELTISSGAITPTGPHHTVDTESDASSDDLDSIDGSRVGLLLLRQEDAARAVTLKHGTAQHDISTPNGADMAMSAHGYVLLYRTFTGSPWTVIGRGDVAAASTTVAGKVELATAAEVDTGTDTTRAVTPDALANSALQTKVDGIEANADVTDVANVDSALGVSNGLIARTADDTFAARTLTGTTDEIDLSAGDGVSGNPTVGLADNAQMPGTEGVRIPGGTTAQRPGTPVEGDLRRNESTNVIEYYDGTDWVDLTTGGGGGGGTPDPLTIPITMSVPEGTGAYPDVHALSTAGAKISGMVLPTDVDGTINAKLAYPIPDTLPSSPTYKVRVSMQPMTGVTSATIHLELKYSARADGESMDVALTDDIADAAPTMSATANARDVQDFTLVTAPAAGDLMMFQLVRDVSEDSFTADVLVTNMCLIIEG